MPRFFFPYFRFLSRLSRPFSFLTIAELKPTIEDQIYFSDYKFRYTNWVRYTGTIDYKDWTMMYISLEMKNKMWTKCVTVNSFIRQCVEMAADDGEANVESPLDLLPEGMLESVEVYTEVLLAPLEFTAQKESPSELQQVCDC